MARYWVLNEPGYHAASQLLYSPLPGLEQVAPMPVAEALKWLDDFYSDFPFAGPAEEANATAFLLTPFLRELLSAKAKVPGLLVDKPTPGTGATYLCQMTTFINTGSSVEPMTVPGTEDEFRKEQLAKYRTLPSAVLFDNVTGTLRSPSLSAVMSTGTFTGRILGASEEITLPVSAQLYMTGNNPGLSNELVRRWVRSRLDARMEQPAERTFSKDLAAWIADHHAELVGACLSICKAWLDAGQPPAPERRVMANYQPWADMLNGVLAHAGIEGFLSNSQEFRDASDTEQLETKELVQLWWDKHTTETVSSKTLYSTAMGGDDLKEDALDLDLGTGNTRSQQICFGYLLRDLRGRVFDLEDGPVRVTPKPAKKKLAQYQLEPLEG